MSEMDNPLAMRLQAAAEEAEAYTSYRDDTRARLYVRSEGVQARLEIGALDANIIIPWSVLTQAEFNPFVGVFKRLKRMIEG